MIVNNQRKLEGQATIVVTYLTIHYCPSLFFSPRPEPKGDNIGFCASGNNAATRAKQESERKTKTAQEELRPAGKVHMQQISSWSVMGTLGRCHRLVSGIYLG